MGNETPEILTTDEAAAYLRVHPSTIYRLLKSKQIPAFKIGSDWRFKRKELDSWVSDRILKGQNGTKGS